MPRNRKLVSATGRAIQPDRMYVSWMGFATSSLPEPTTMRTGSLVRGSHPVMQYCAHCFVEADVPRHEWPDPFREAMDQPVGQETA